MAADANDVAILRELADRARTQVAARGQPHGAIELGVMLEIPSAVLVLETYADRIGFASLGTNDLPTISHPAGIDNGPAMVAPGPGAS